MHHAFHLALAQAHAADLHRIAAAERLARTRRKGATTRAARALAGLAGVLLMLGGCGGSNNTDSRRRRPPTEARLR